MSLNNALGKEVIVKFSTRDIKETLCTLTWFGDVGVTLSDSSKNPQFKARFFPWNVIEYLDLQLTDNARTRVA